MPTTEEEYETKIRDPAEFFFDDAFSTENGRPSISMLIKNLPVGDYALLPNHEDIKQEDNVLAGDDYHIMEKCVTATDGWKLELMSTDERNLDWIASGDVPDTIAGPQRVKREKVRKELCRSIAGNLRHNGMLLPARDPGYRHGGHPNPHGHRRVGELRSY
jgi:hypothetical protein